jgi:hypothetical protein
MYERHGVALVSLVAAFLVGHQALTWLVSTLQSVVIAIP